MEVLHANHLPDLQKKSETSTTSYGKRVERLKSIIKSCGMRYFRPLNWLIWILSSTSFFHWSIICCWSFSFHSSVPPSVYRKAKQAPESKREAYLMKEMEEILRREGLSTNPSEKGEDLIHNLSILFKILNKWSTLGLPIHGLNIMIDNASWLAGKGNMLQRY